MDVNTILQLVKERLGIRTNARDTYLTAIVNGIIKELEDEKGLVLEESNSYHLLFCVDYATWRYQSRDSEGSMPRHLQYRLHNLIVHVGAKNLRVIDVVSVDTLPDIPALYTVYILPDGSQQMYISGIWTAVDMVGGQWQVVVL